MPNEETTPPKSLATPQLVPGQQVMPQPPQFSLSLYQATQAPWQQRPAIGPAGLTAPPASTCVEHGAPSARPAQLTATQATVALFVVAASAATRPDGQATVPLPNGTPHWPLSQEHPSGADVAAAPAVGGIGAEIDRAANALATGPLRTPGERAGRTLIRAAAPLIDAHGTRRAGGRDRLGAAMANGGVDAAVLSVAEARAAVRERARGSAFVEHRRERRDVVVTGACAAAAACPHCQKQPDSHDHPGPRRAQRGSRDDHRSTRHLRAGPVHVISARSSFRRIMGPSPRGSGLPQVAWNRR